MDNGLPTVNRPSSWAYRLILLLRLAAGAIFFFINDKFTGDLHASPLIEAGGPRGVAGIDAQADNVLAATMELCEGVHQQGVTQPPLAPQAVDTQCAYPADSLPLAALR